jgi:hypothetical protein
LSRPDGLEASNEGKELESAADPEPPEPDSEDAFDEAPEFVWPEEPPGEERSD